jgi:hypothetical protein
MFGFFIGCVGVYIGYQWGWVKGVDEGEGYSTQSVYGRSKY